MCKITINDEEFSLTEDQFNQIKAICYNPVSRLTLKKQFELKNFNFYIKDYQRGYRWTDVEITDLLEDINNIEENEEGYCLQPLIVKSQAKLENQELYKLCSKKEEAIIKSNESPNNLYELLDGQQRLTTLLLILSILDLGDSYNIYYELDREIDKHYIKKAKKTIETWLSKKCSHNKNDYITKIKKIFFIWYEINDKNTTSEAIFKSINEGKIELTNAELFKAMLLNPDNLETNNGDNQNNLLQQIAFEWDKLEISLHDDDFWYFISQSDIENRYQSTRLDYIIELYALIINENNTSKKRKFDPNKDRFSFLVIQDYINKEYKEKKNLFNIVKKIWEEIVKTYDKLYSWYKDDELYHTIGYLVASDELNNGSKSLCSNSIFELYKYNLDSAKKTAKELIYKRLIKAIELPIDDINYEYDDKELVSKTILKHILLFTNIYTLLPSQNNEFNHSTHLRFPFKIYNQNNWDIEHISPKQINKNIGKQNLKDFKEIMRAFKEENIELGTKDKIDKFLIDPTIDECSYENNQIYKDLVKAWENYADEVLDSADNNIVNLVLLNSSINRSYGNAFFSKKRAAIIDNDKKGIFIPICTRNVFMKYYTNSPENLSMWTDADKEEYKKYLKDMIEKIKEWK